MPPRVLVVCERARDGAALAAGLAGLGCSVALVSAASEALDEARREPFDVALCDLGRHPRRALELVSALRAEQPGLEVVALTEEAGFDTVVEAMRRGAADYLVAPVALPALQRLVERFAGAGRTVELRAAQDHGVPAAPVPGGAFTLSELEREHVRRVLAWASSLAEAARVLGVDRGTLRKKLARWGDAVPS